jgi:hypothetical protein
MKWDLQKSSGGGFALGLLTGVLALAVLTFVIGTIVSFIGALTNATIFLALFIASLLELVLLLILRRSWKWRKFAQGGLVAIAILGLLPALVFGGCLLLFMSVKF